MTDSVSITCAAGDNLSGIDRLHLCTVRGAAYTFGAGVNTLTHSATDGAGNVGTGSTTFTLEVTPAGVCD